MITYILVWVLIISPSNSQHPTVISAPMVDLESCMRLQKAADRGSYRFTQCVQIKVPK